MNSTLHEDVIWITWHAASLLGHNAGVRHGALDLCQHVQGDGLLRHGVVRHRGYLQQWPLRLGSCRKRTCQLSYMHCLATYKGTSAVITAMISDTMLDLGCCTTLSPVFSRFQLCLASRQKSAFNARSRRRVASATGTGHPNAPHTAREGIAKQRARQRGTCDDRWGIGWRLVDHNTHAPHCCRR